MKITGCEIFQVALDEDQYGRGSCITRPGC